MTFAVSALLRKAPKTKVLGPRPSSAHPLTTVIWMDKKVGAWRETLARSGAFCSPRRRTAKARYRQLRGTFQGLAPSQFPVVVRSVILAPKAISVAPLTSPSN